VYGQLFKAADPDGFDVVSGDVAVKFFEKTKLPPDVLGQVGLQACCTVHSD
jgi:epidermal growth factor receptor substrate 15